MVFVVCVPVPVPPLRASGTAPHKDKPAHPTPLSSRVLYTVALAAAVLTLTAYLSVHAPPTATTAATVTASRSFFASPLSYLLGSGDGGGGLFPQPSHRSTREVCASLGMFVDTNQVERRREAQHRRPRVSIVFVTKRPGGYDALLNSLAQQTVKDSQVYELVCVDELAPYRVAKVYAMAEALGVPLVAVVPSKPKQSQFRTTRFGLYNALNTGLLHTRGDIITFATDHTWLPPNFLERTLEFYGQKQHAKSLLAYPEQNFLMRKSAMPVAKAFENEKSVTLFAQNLTQPFKRFSAGRGRPDDLVRAHANQQPLGFEKQPRLQSPTGKSSFWELTLASVPWSALEEMNGLEEEHDVGDDCHEVNVRLRAEFLGYDLWIDGETVVEALWHRDQFQKTGDLWNKSPQNTVKEQVVMIEMGQIARGERSPRSGNNPFDLAQWRKHDCPINI